MTRLLNIAWAYGVIGLCGTVLIFIFQPLLTMLNVAPLQCDADRLDPTAPVLAILIYVINITLCDFYSVSGGVFFCMPLVTTLVGYVAIGGVMQAAIALILAVVEPVLTLVPALCAIIVWLLGHAKDGFVWVAFLGGSARVPRADTFIARRIAGPGLATSFFFQISRGGGHACANENREAPD